MNSVLAGLPGWAQLVLALSTLVLVLIVSTFAWTAIGWAVLGRWWTALIAASVVIVAVSEGALVRLWHLGGDIRDHETGAVLLGAALVGLPLALITAAHRRWVALPSPDELAAQRAYRLRRAIVLG